MNLSDVAPRLGRVSLRRLPPESTSPTAPADATVTSSGLVNWLSSPVSVVNDTSGPNAGSTSGSRVLFTSASIPSSARTVVLQIQTLCGSTGPASASVKFSSGSASAQVTVSATSISSVAGDGNTTQALAPCAGSSMYYDISNNFDEVVIDIVAWL